MFPIISASALAAFAGFLVLQALVSTPIAAAIVLAAGYGVLGLRFISPAAALALAGSGIASPFLLGPASLPWMAAVVFALVGWTVKPHVALIPSISIVAGVATHWLLASIIFGAIVFFVAVIVTILLIAPKSAVPTGRATGFFDPAKPSSPIISSIHGDSEVELSVILPAYNEAKRLPPFLKDTLHYLAKQQYSSEVIIVDDGSRDTTFDECVSFIKQYGANQVRLLKLVQNCGKGAAVREGMIRARGKFCLFCDADGAAPVSQWIELRDKMIKADSKGEKLKQGGGGGICVGVREKQARTGFRLLLSWGWHMAVQVLCRVGVRDSQCGYKLFSREAARRIFPNQHLDRWCFDVEVLYMARVLGIPVDVVQVQWNEIEGSKVSWRSIVFMLFELVQLRFCYQLGLWVLPTH